jgi:2-C-methyl-D-erythritol 4-phosphate cytidylyltransferase
METWAIIVAGGRGSRFGRPKQYAELEGRRLIDWAVQAAAAVCDGIVVVLPAADVATTPVVGADAVTAGGASRSASVRAGLAFVPASAAIVVVHDAVRPLASTRLWTAVVNAVAEGADAAIPGVEVTDTIKRVQGGQATETLDRSQLVAVQTPQAFASSAIRAAHASAADATDDAALVERAGGRVVVVPGELHNVKVTSPADLDIVAALLTRSRTGKATR